MIGALTLVLGERADKDLIRTGAESCSVEAVFENADDERISSLLDRHGAEPCEDGRLLVKRVVSPDRAREAVCQRVTLHTGIASLVGKFPH